VATLEVLAVLPDAKAQLMKVEMKVEMNAEAICKMKAEAICKM
jgi:hypothetical protein